MKHKQVIMLVSSLIIIGLFLLPLSARAQADLKPFGGIVSFSLPCTCSGTTWIWFAPLYLGGEAVTTGPLVYSPFSTVLYAYFMIGVPGTRHLGDYIPAVPACWMSAKLFCFPFPATGLMSKVGTNYLLPEAP